MTREICQLCHLHNAIGFSVPNQLWKRVVPAHRQNDNICIQCFAKMADQLLLPWDQDIELFPVSQHTLLNYDEEANTETTPTTQQVN